MARATVLGRLTWQIGEVVETVAETPRVRTLVVDVPEWPGHRAGQHVDLRLTAEDGYQAVRSYSIASPPEEQMVGLCVERLDDGEVSPYLVDELRVGDQLELRGPIGGYFVWEAHLGGPLFLVAGGSGIVPLMAMTRHRIAAGSNVPIKLLYSSRTPDDVIFQHELESLHTGQNGVEVIQTFTRSQPRGWTGYSRRIDLPLLEEAGWPSTMNPLAFVCGPTQFVETAATALLALGYEPGRIKTERFGPTGR